MAAYSMMTAVLELCVLCYLASKEDPVTQVGKDKRTEKSFSELFMPMRNFKIKEIL
jgi:hypothetical protein